MIKDIVRDDFFLSQKSVEATLEDVNIAVDLIDTLKKHHGECVGMAANMIGYLKRVIIFTDENEHMIVMFNPEIMKTSGKCFETDEGCLSHVGVKKVKRFTKIKVEYQDVNFKKKIKTFEGFTAQIIQHEMDHLEGILI